MTIFNYAILDMATFNNPSISEGSSPHNQQNGISPSYFLLALLPSFCGSFEKEYCYYYGICFQFISFVDLRNFLIFCYGYSFCRKKKLSVPMKRKQRGCKKRFQWGSRLHTQFFHIFTKYVIIMCQRPFFRVTTSFFFFSKNIFLSKGNKSFFFRRHCSYPY